MIPPTMESNQFPHNNPAEMVLIISKTNGMPLTPPVLHNVRQLGQETSASNAMTFAPLKEYPCQCFLFHFFLQKKFKPSLGAIAHNMLHAVISIVAATLITTIIKPPTSS